ncbi:hypothetical protein HMPREF9629_00236 [Peptoanaerobacter stomatis]|uniref:Fimbrial assembly protein PilN n=1 Tax=Peptoanaerobacter stomatis TaxID=796937 RepID=G9X077_9FIRM|nr:PilN domain-containing protein [Peptoanaerobacter stomatis]EHL15497.1 hypothetical protein HMPREF9629_00236 [Peptoanaerobacter stomatis]
MRDFNFFMPYQQQISEKKTSSSNIIPIAVGAGVAVICLALAGFNYMNIMSMNRSISELDSKMNNEEFVSDVGRVQGKIDELNSLKKDEIIFGSLKIFVDIQSKVNESVVRLIASQVPDNLYLMDLSIVQDSIDIKGRANSEVAIAQFQHNLRLTDEFKNIFVSDMNKEESYYNFNIKFDAKGAIEDEDKQ